MESERQVSYEKANEYAKDNGMMYFETSAITDSGIEDAFTKFIESWWFVNKFRNFGDSKRLEEYWIQGKEWFDAEFWEEWDAW